MEMTERTYRTSGRHGYNVKFSPYHGNRLACATSQNYGISGSGTLFILDCSVERPISSVFEHHWKDGLFDVTWSESNENIIVTGSGDGSIQIWDAFKLQEPISVLRGHCREVYGLDWNQTRREQYLLSGSWDQTAIVWDTERSSALSTYRGHGHYVYCAMWSPLLSGCFATTSGDGMLRIWDIKQPGHPSIQCKVHSTDVLSCDWCKYNKDIIVTSGAEGLIKGWDVRNIHKPIFQLVGHEYAVRRVKFSPHEESVLCSVSYDLTTRFWNWNVPEPFQTIQHHTEFVYGLDFNIHVPNEIADCGWDESIHVFHRSSTRT